VANAAGVAALVGVHHDVPPDVLPGVVHWFRKGGHDPVIILEGLRTMALEGGAYCVNDGCEVVGLLKGFKVYPLCKTARYWRRVSERGLDNGWAQGHVWHIRRCQLQLLVCMRKRVAHSPRQDGV
jgi:hypothetical protein